MLRSLILTPFLAAAALVAHAQMGPRIGLGLATQSVGGLFQNTSNLMPGPLVGWHFEAPVHPQVSIMPELLFMTKGFAVRNPAQATRTRSTFRYLEAPILAKISLDKEEGGLYLLAGPAVGYFLNGRTRLWQEDQLLFDNKYTLPANGRRVEVSGLVGMGVEGDKWAFDVRAQTSLTPFERFTRIQNVVYALTVAYRMNTGR
jgi:hypothetical protein